MDLWPNIYRLMFSRIRGRVRGGVGGGGEQLCIVLNCTRMSVCSFKGLLFIHFAISVVSLQKEFCVINSYGILFIYIEKKNDPFSSPPLIHSPSTDLKTSSSSLKRK